MPEFVGGTKIVMIIKIRNHFRLQRIYGPEEEQDISHVRELNHSAVHWTEKEAGRIDDEVVGGACGQDTGDLSRYDSCWDSWDG
jgi:hypothetical protein